MAIYKIKCAKCGNFIMGPEPFSVLAEKSGWAPSSDKKNEFICGKCGKVEKPKTHTFKESKNSNSIDNNEIKD